MMKTVEKVLKALRIIVFGLILIWTVYNLITKGAISSPALNVMAVLGVIWLVLFAVHKIIRHLRGRSYLDCSLKRIDGMSGEEFEEYCAVNFKEIGYDVIQTKQSVDFGADMIIEKDGIKTAVQCKRYSVPVGLSAVQEVVASVRYYRADRAMVITNTSYTRSSRILGEVNEVILIDRDGLIDLFNSK